MKLFRAFERSVNREPSRTAVRAIDGRSFTYRELDERTNALANVLDNRIPGNRRCASLLENGIPAVETVIAAHKRGVANVQLFTRGAPDEIASMIESASPGGFIYDEQNADLAESVLERVDVDTVLSVGNRLIEDAAPYEEAINDASRTRDSGPQRSEAAVFYTSGTTGVPKGILYDQEKLWLGSLQTLSETGFDPTDKGLAMIPWYHMFTYANSILPHLHVGASLVIQPSFDADEALRAIEAHDVTNVIAVPAQLKEMVARQREAEYDLSSLMRIRTGGAPTTESLVEAVDETLGADIRVLYGLSEGGATVTHSYPHEQRERPYTVGKEAFMWNVRVVTPADPPAKPDPDDIVEPGGTGEVLVKGPAMATGYLDNQDAEEALFVGDWIRTRDVADIDAEGYLSIVDRVDNMLVSGGEKVYPQEVERVLAEHPRVSDVCVVGVADERWGETVAAIIVPGDDVDEETLDSFCVEHDGLADFKRPRLYAFTNDELPRTASGTLERVSIRERFFGDGESGR